MYINITSNQVAVQLNTPVILSSNSVLQKTFLFERDIENRSRITKDNVFSVYSISIFFVRQDNTEGTLNYFKRNFKKTIFRSIINIIIYKFNRLLNY